MELIAADALKALGWGVLHHDIQVAHVQIDLLTRDPHGVLTIVEVKSKSALTHISQRQLRRLLNAGQVLAGFEPVQLVFAQVSGSDVLVLPVDGLTA